MATEKGLYDVKFTIDDPSTGIIFYEILESKRKEKVPATQDQPAWKPSSQEIIFTLHLLDALRKAASNPVPSPTLSPTFLKVPIIVVPSILPLLLDNYDYYGTGPN